MVFSGSPRLLKGGELSESNRGGKVHQDILECFVVRITRTGWNLTTVVLNIQEKREGGEKSGLEQVLV